MVVNEEGFGIILGFAGKRETGRNCFQPALIYFQNKIFTAKKGHSSAAAGKWAYVVVRDKVTSIIQVMQMSLVKTRFRSQTDFKMYAKFTVIDSQTVHNEFCGSATVVREHREYIAKSRGYVFGSVRPNKNWELTFQLREAPNVFPFNHATPILTASNDGDPSDRLDDQDSGCGSASPFDLNRFSEDVTATESQHQKEGREEAEPKPQPERHVTDPKAVFKVVEKEVTSDYYSNSARQETKPSTVTKIHRPQAVPSRETAQSVLQLSKPVKPMKDCRRIPVIKKRMSADDCSKTVPQETKAAIVTKDQFPGLGLPYRKTGERMPQLPKPKLHIYDESFDHYQRPEVAQHFTERELTYEDYYKSKQRLEANRVTPEASDSTFNQRPSSYQYLRSRSPQNVRALVLNEDSEAD